MEQQQRLKEMLSEAVREALQVKREKAPVGDGKQTPTDPKIRESPNGSGKRGGYSKGSGHWAPRLERTAGARARRPGTVDPTGSQASGAWQWWRARLPWRGWAWHIDNGV